MDLSNNHRTALIAEFKKSLEFKETLRHRLNSETAKESSLCITEYWEIEDFLNNERLKAIELALSDVEIEY